MFDEWKELSVLFFGYGKGLCDIFEVCDNFVFGVDSCCGISENKLVVWRWIRL